MSLLDTTTEKCILCCYGNLGYAEGEPAQWKHG